MRNVFLAALFTILSTTVMAELPAYSVTQEIDHTVEKISSEEVKALKTNKYNNCYAYTACNNGRVIQCQTFGQGCTFYTQPYQYVQCSGYNNWGQWVNTFASCY